ncbi:MAG: M28 family peptidase [Bacteroidota bacterium]
MKPTLLFLFLVFALPSFSQTNIISTNPVAENVLLGTFNPATYQPSGSFTKSQIVQGIWNNLSTDSMLANLHTLAAFHNRNTGSDTVSGTKGVGAARRWVHAKLQQYSALNQNRLIPSYLQFDQTICTITQHRNIFAVLPGTDTSDKSVIIMEAHMDSRCETVCDTACLAQGMEDNGSGTVLVMELARVMSKYSYKQSIVFLITIGEEQGLDGANAFATYCKNKGIQIEAVLNNDVVGGIICGKTASPPGCPGENLVDSMSVRLFSAGTNSSPHKSLVRFIKLEYQEEVKPWMNVPTTIHVMNAEDRTGRGGDHIPFRSKGYTAMRFTSTHEAGDANIVPGYTDRQHSTRDVLGKDINMDGTFDSFYVDANYLKRNAMINANTATMAAIGPPQPGVLELGNDGNGLTVVIPPVAGINTYRVGIRTAYNDFDSVYTLTGTNVMKTYNIKKDSIYFVSAASVDANGTESIFNIEKYIKAVAQPNTGTAEPLQPQKAVELLGAMPNPFDETTTLSVLVNGKLNYKTANITITDIQGRTVSVLPVVLNPGINEVLYEHGFNQKGLFNYSLLIDGKIWQTGRMLFK